MRTTYIAKEADIVKKWYVIDAEGVTLGRLASEVASILRGKNKPQYAPNADMGDYVIIVNAEKVAVTGKKLEQKMYRLDRRSERNKTGQNAGNTPRKSYRARCKRYAS